MDDKSVDLLDERLNELNRQMLAMWKRVDSQEKLVVDLRIDGAVNSYKIAIALSVIFGAFNAVVTAILLYAKGPK